MLKTTKTLFDRLKELRPILHSISYYYGTDWKSNVITEIWYLEYPNKHLEFTSEKELQNEMKRMIISTQSDLGFRFPETTKKLKLE